MKLLTLTLALLLSLTAHCQLTKADSAQVNSLIDKKITEFSKTLDSVIIKNIKSSNATTFNIDTLKVPLNTTVVFELDLVGFDNKGNSCTGYKRVAVRNLNGALAVVNQSNYPSMSGGLKASWNVYLSGANMVVEIKPLANPTDWKYFKHIKAK